MGFFNNFNGMGPEGAQVPEPKTGLGRVWQIITRDMLGLLGSGILAGITALVYIVSLFFAMTSHGLIFVLVGCTLGGAIAMPQIVGVADTVLRGIRNEAGFWGMRYRKAWKRNFKQSAVFGLIAGFLFGFQYFMLMHTRNQGLFIVVLMLAGAVISISVATWAVPQIALMELPLGRILLNSLVLSAQHPIKTIIAVAVTLVYWLFMVVTYPFSTLLYVLFNFWLPMLICLQTLWKPIDEAFNIKESIDELNAKKRAEEKAAEAADSAGNDGEEE